MKTIATLFTLALGALAPSVHAQWYAGGSIARSDATLSANTRNEQLLDLGFDGASTSVDDKDTAFRAYGGYRFHRYGAVEAGYVDLGRFGLRSSVAPAGSLASDMRIRGADLSLLGLLPVGERFTLFGRVGVLAARTRSSFSGSGSVVINDGSGDSQRSSGALYGVGGMADISERLGVRVEFIEHRKLGDDLTGDFRVRTLAAGLQYRF